jgi:hypothetical protein
MAFVLSIRERLELPEFLRVALDERGFQS